MVGRRRKRRFLSSNLEQELQMLSHVRGFSSHVSHQEWTAAAKSVRSEPLSVPNEAEAERLPGISLVNCCRRTHRCGDHPHKISSTVTSANPGHNIIAAGKQLEAEQETFDSAVFLLWCFKLRIVHACLDSSLAWVGGWRGVVETLFGRRPRVLVSYVLMLQPCMDYIQERDSLDMATEQDDC